MEYTKIISQELISRLEGAFETLMADIKNPVVIALIKYPKAGEQIYLIAKDPKENTYYGILEGKTETYRQIFSFPESNINCIEFKEEKIIPFRANPYLESGRFDYIELAPITLDISFNEIQIGSQIWMRENLNQDKFLNGDIITEAKTIQEWNSAGDNKQPAWCVYENDATNEILYGKLYNWYAVNDPRCLSPIGWKIPSDSDWLILINLLGGEDLAGSKIRYKNSFLTEGSSISGFDGRLGGHRMAAGHFVGMGEFTTWWSATEDGSTSALSRGISFHDDYIGQRHSNKGFGYFVRCIKLTQTSYKFSFPTRNEARAIIIALVKQYSKINGSGSVPKKELTTYASLLYKTNGIDYSTFIFTNALIDVFTDMNVDSENYVDNSILALGNKTKADIEQYFIRNLGESFENIINISVKESSEYNVLLNSQGNSSLDLTWFNNSNSFVRPLLTAYQSFKKRKGMLFQKEDIKQIPIDYSVVLCYNHYRQKGFLNDSICSQIVKILTEATNECINTIAVNPKDIEFFVKHDLKSPDRINSAFDFIKQF